MRRWMPALLAGLAACGSPSPAPDLLATVDGEPIAYQEFESYLESHTVDPDVGWGSDLLSALLDQFLDEELLGRLAGEEGLSPAGGGRAAVEALLAGRLGAAIGDAEVESYFHDNAAEFERPERVRLHQILLEDEAQVARVESELAAGAGFAEVAERFSQVPLGSLGGDALLAREDLPPAFADAVFALEVGEISAPIATDYGIHLFEVVERVPAGRAPLAAVAGEIRERLRGERAQQTLERLVGEVRARYDVDVFERNLPFNYQGVYSDFEESDLGAGGAGGGPPGG